jgi:hypothetical protein
MVSGNSEFWNRAHRARDKLADRFLNHPDVSLIDIGYPMERGKIISEDIVLRVHVRQRWMKAKPEERVTFPEKVDDIPVMVMLGEYQPEANTGSR